MKWPSWLNLTVFGVGIASFFGDLGYESVTILLPSFLIILGAPVYALGVIEGLSDGASSFVKLFSGYFADKLGKRREFALGGNWLQSIGIAWFAFFSYFLPEKKQCTTGTVKTLKYQELSPFLFPVSVLIFYFLRLTRCRIESQISP